MTKEPRQRDILTWQDFQNHAQWWSVQLTRALQFFQQVITRHWRISWPLMGGFAAVAIGLLYLDAQAYQLQTTYVYNELHPKIFGEMGKKLNALIQYGQYDQVADLMSLNEEQARFITSIQITDERGKPFVENYAYRKEPMVVTLTMQQPIAADSLRAGLTQFLNSNPFIADRLEHKKDLLREELIFVERKLKTVDSVLTNVYANGDSSEGAETASSVKIENSTGKDAYDLFQFSRELMKRKSQIQNELFQPNNATPVDNFLVLPKARFAAGPILKRGLSGALLGFALASLVVFLRRSPSK